jgi:cellulose synthase/poly-beta-1,6-N-acetylglucosamine synthase-like glycosyltransferase
MTAGNWPRVSVIVPCRNEERYVATCLEAILATEYPADRLEVIVAEGRSDDRTREVVQRYADCDPRVRLLDNPRRITPAALNLAIGAASGDVVVRMDAHAVFPPSYIGRLVSALDETGAEVVGGAVDTVPADDGPVAAAIAIAMRHRFGVGNSPFRIGGTKRRSVDHVPFFCCRRELFERVGLFDEELVRNQDGEFSARVIRAGGRVVLIPEARARYFARASLPKLARTFYQYGYYKLLTAIKVRRVMTLRQLVPPAFILTLLATALATPWEPASGAAFAALAGTYAALVSVTAVIAARGRRLRCAGVLIVAFPLMHFSYGFGQLRRAAELAARRRALQTDPVFVPLSR